jgi:hypothetical protein
MYTAGNILQAASAYHNFGTTVGTSGYGVRDNAGTMEYKNSGGSWTAFNASSTVMATGSVTAPGLAFSGDSDTGFYQATANTLSVTAGSVEAIRFETATSGVNYFDVTPAAAGASPIIGVAGSDTDIGIKLTPKGAGDVLISSGSLGIGTTTASAQLHLAGSKSAASWTLSGIGLRADAATYTDTTGSGAITTRVGNSFAIPTFASSSAVTVNNAATLFVNGAPLAGTNTTITNAYAFYINTGNARLDGWTGFGSIIPTAVVTIGGNQSSASWTTTGANFAVSANTLTATTGTSTVTTRVANSFAQPTFASSNAITVTNAANLYIADAPAAGTNTTITNAYALYIAAGNTLHAGLNSFGGTTVPAAVVHIAGNQSAAAWSNSGLLLRVAGVTLTDTSSSGTVAFAAASGFGTPTLAASSATTYTNAANLYIAAAPTAGTNVTLTNAWALYLAAGNMYTAGNILQAASAYHNFGTTVGTSGYGVRDNAGTMEYKNSGGSWTAFNASSTVMATGSVTAPGLAFSGDSDTGFYQATANTLSVTAGSIEAIRFETATSGVNYFDVTPAAAGASPIIGVAGSDTDIGIKLTPKGAGNVVVTSGNFGIGTTSPAAQLFLSGNKSAAAWTTSGIGIVTYPATYTDTTSSGAVAGGYIHRIGQPTIAASSATTYASATTLAVMGGPLAGTNMTITNALALYVGGNTRMDGFNGFGGVNPSSVVQVGGSQSSTSWTTRGLNFAVDANTLTDTSGTGTIGTRVANSFGTPTLASSSAETITVAANVYIAGAPAAGTNTTITNPYALYIANGNTRMDGWNGFGSVSPPAAVVHIGGSQSSTAWTTNGLNLRITGNTLTDTSSSGTVASVVTSSFGTPTLAASSATTYTNAATVFINSAPSAGSNVTITNPYSLWVNSGNARFESFAGFGGIVPTAIVHVGGNQSAASWTTNGLNFRVQANTLTNTTSSGTVATIVANAIAQPTLAASSATTYTNAANLYIGDAPAAGTNVTLTNAWALYLAAGNMYSAGNILQAASAYHNFGTTVGTSGYGVRDNAGTMEYKNSGGSWTGFNASSTVMATGSVTAPGLAFSGDLDTGFYQASANTLSVTAGSIEAMRFNTATSGVNYFNITPAAASASPIIGVAGSDTDIGIKLTPKGAGNVLVTSGFLGIGTTSAAAQLHLAGNQSAAAWTTSGIALRTDAATYTDTTSAGTSVGTVGINALGVPTIAASSAVTIAHGVNLYVAGPPTAGTNVTLSKAWAIMTPSTARSYFGGLNVGASVNNGLLTIGSNFSTTSWTTTGAYFTVTAGTATDTSGSGTIAVRTASAFQQPTFASSSAVTVTNAANVYISDAPAAGTNTTLTNAWALYIATGNVKVASGNVGIGMNPTYPLDVTGDIRTSTCLRYASSTLGTCTSDAALKKNITPYKLGLNEVVKLKAVTFSYNGLGGNQDDGKTQIGLIAQDVEKVAPELVGTQNVKLHPDDKETTAVKTVNYSTLTYMLINAVQELNTKLAALGAKLEELSAKLDKLTAEASTRVADNVKDIGTTIENGMTRITSLVVNKVTVGSTERPTGITLFDEVTGKPYCLKIRSGAIVRSKGACGDAAELKKKKAKAKPVSYKAKKPLQAHAPELLAPAQ